MSDRTCSIEGCAKPARKRGWCTSHYDRWHRHGDPLAGRHPRDAPARCIEAALASATDECIIWPYTIGTYGYGRVYVEGVLRDAHRVVLERMAGPAPSPGMDAAHAPLVCHNRACVNPRHLRWATRKQNNADKLIDGTHVRGERNASTKLTPVQVLAIFRGHQSHAALASEYGVTESNIRAIRNGRSWGWLTHTSAPPLHALHLIEETHG